MSSLHWFNPRTGEATWTRPKQPQVRQTNHRHVGHFAPDPVVLPAFGSGGAGGCGGGECGNG
eukprot:gene2051-14333_t